MVTGFLCAGGAVALALLVAIYSKLCALPPRVWAIAKQERAQDTRTTEAALLEAAALKVGPIVTSLRQHQEQLAASFRAQLAEAEVRTRLVERRLVDTAAVLGAASALVRDLRGALDKLSEPRAVLCADPVGPGAADRTERATLAMPRGYVVGLPRAAAKGDEPDEEERTAVGPTPRAAAPASVEGPR